MWIPTSEEEILKALQGGHLVETTTFDAKAQPDKSIDIAKDIAAFANDGGVIIYGIGEDEHKRITINSPIDLKGEADRIQQVVRTSIAEAPLISIIPIYCEHDPVKGYLVVIIPPSTRAPHMVILQKHNRYYGRNDKESYPLSEGEVARLYQRRQQSENGVNADLSELITEMQFPPDEHRVQLYIAIKPLFSDMDMLQRSLRKENEPTFLNRAVRYVGSIEETDGWHNETFPSWRRVLDGWETSLMDLEATDPEFIYNLRVLNSGAGIIARGEIGKSKIINGQNHRLLNEAAVVSYTKQFLTFFGFLYDHSRYLGPVDLKITITGMQDTISSYLNKSSYRHMPQKYPHPHNDYQRTYRVLASVLHEESGRRDIMRFILQPLFDALTQGRYRPFDQN